MSAKTVNKRNTIVDDATVSSSAAICAEDAMDTTVTLIPADAPESETNVDQPTVVDVSDKLAAAAPDERAIIDGDCATLEPQPDATDRADSSATDDTVNGTANAAAEPVDSDVSASTAGLAEDSVQSATEDDAIATDITLVALESVAPVSAISHEVTVDVSAGETDASVTEADVPSLPDPSSISARLKNLVVAVSQVEELSRRAREVAASDMALYDGIAASQRQFEDGLAEARRIGQEAEAVYDRAFGREATAVAEPALAEARQVEQAFHELATAWRQQAETFLTEHPDVESLLAEQRQRDDEARRRDAARAKAQRFQELVTTTDAALRQGLLDDAKACLDMLGREFPAEASRIAPLQERLQHRVRAANDAAARRVLFQASELQGRGDFDAAVKLLEAVEVNGLSRETSEDLFGRWSAACSLLGQSGDLELLRSSAAQGRGIILHRDPSVPYGLVVFSALGMGPAYFQGRVVSAADREGAAIIGRARAFRAAELPPDLSGGWYGHSYVTTGASSEPVRH